MDNQNIHVKSNTTPENIEKHSQRFHLVLFSDTDEMHELWLPVIPEGFFRFSDSFEHRFLNIASVNGVWIAVCKKTAFFRNVPVGQNCEIPLVDNQLLEIDFEDRTYSLYTEIVSEKQMVYHNYPIYSDVEISIGRQMGNDIRYDNPYVSRKHAILQRSAGKWSIQDFGSIYGVYVNGTKKDNSILKTGDVICIMGLRIIIGPNFLSIRDGSGTIAVNRRILQDALPAHGGYSHYYGQDNLLPTEGFFNRLPRKRIEMKQTTITVEGPPMSLDQKQLPLMLRLGSSMVMGGTAAMAGNFMTLISGVMFPFLSSKFTDKQRQEYEQLRLTKYREYLTNKRTEIENACREEYLFLNKKYPPLCNVIDVAKKSSHLWERRPGDSDFLQVRLGTGTQRLTTAIEYPPRRFELETDKLEEEMYSLVETPYYVKNAPVILPMADTVVCGLLGRKKQIIEYIRQLVLQFSVFHSYDEVKTMFFVSKEDLAFLDEIRYLPHAWDDQRAMRFIATDEAEAYKLGEYIKDRISNEKEGEKELARILKKRPYYLIFALDKKLFDCHEVMKDILHSYESRGISIITAFDDLLKESQKIITLKSDQKCVCTTMSADGGDDVLFNMDSYDRKEFTEAMRILANTRLKTAAQEQELPKMITFLEMFKAGRIEQLNPIKRWQESNPVKSLAAPVGVGPDGSLFMLDLHEKRQGPHGLVAGMTGSGKSEFLITYILSMAINYHPDEVSFVLIDYKGGGLADAFQNPEKGIQLPHLVGTITNLDGPSIQRSLMSIESELVRRQQVFKEAKSLVNEGTMDIYDYQKLYREGKVSKPMPHLFIISDEFAELKQQQPEFMDKLISAARIGRSLGVHLILATQKPSGVVNDQIRSNTKFRVCLRVQERSDSMDMLKRPEAAELTDTGRFYLQVGYNEYFAMGQSAWCGAPYEQQDVVTVKRDDAVEFLDTAGQVIATGKPKTKKIDSGMKQIVAIVNYLSDLAKTHSIKTRALWEPELPEYLDLEEYQKKHTPPHSMAVCLGKIDDPENLSQVPMFMDFQSCGNLMIVGDSRSGKSTLIQNIIYSLVKQLSPEEFHFYLLAYSNRNQKILQSLPHCGAVLVDDDSNMLDDFFKLIDSITNERKQIFDELKVSDFEEARKLRKLALILVFIDNWAGLTATREGETHGYKLQNYLKNTAKYGIKYVISAAYSNEVSARIRQEMTEHICLHLKDRYDYSDLLGCKVTYQPLEKPGRGIVIVDGRPLEFQGLLLGGKRGQGNETDTLKHCISAYQRNSFQGQARRMAVIQEKIEFEIFAAQFTEGRLPLGYSLNPRKPIAFPFIQLSALSVYLGNPTGRIPVIQNILHGAVRENMELWICARDNGSISPEILEASFKSREYPLDEDSCNQLRLDLLDEITRRLEFTKDYQDWKAQTGPHGKDDVSLFYSFMGLHTTPLLIFFENFSKFCSYMDTTSESILIKLFGLTKRLNIYLVGMFEPEDIPKQSGKGLYSCFNPERNILLLGGQFHKQNLLDLPKDLTTEKQIPFNKGLMYYRSGIYPFLMPCGEIEEEVVNRDLGNIFM